MFLAPLSFCSSLHLNPFRACVCVCVFVYLCVCLTLRNFLSISSNLFVSLTNVLWNAFVSMFRSLNMTFPCFPISPTTSLAASSGMYICMSDICSERKSV